MKPTDSVQRWLVARAATASVRLDRCVERENLALEENTAKAERAFFRRRRAWARRLGARLDDQTEKAYAKLLGSAFGCDWLIARFDDLAADLEIPGGYWSRDEFLRALRLLGFEPKRIPPGHPAVATLYRASLAADKAPDPTEVDAFLHLDTKDLEPEARAVEQRGKLGEREKGRQTLLEFVRREQERLRDLREDLWDEVDAAELEQACALRGPSTPAPRPPWPVVTSRPTPWNCTATWPTSTAPVARRSSARTRRRTNVKMGKIASQVRKQKDSASDAGAFPASPERSGGVGESVGERGSGVARRDAGDAAGRRNPGRIARGGAGNPDRSGEPARATLTRHAFPTSSALVERPVTIGFGCSTSGDGPRSRRLLPGPCGRWTVVTPRNAWVSRHRRPVESDAPSGRIIAGGIPMARESPSSSSSRHRSRSWTRRDVFRLAAAGAVAGVAPPRLPAAEPTGFPGEKGRPLELDPGPHLFLDDDLVDRLEGLERRAEPLQRRERPVLDRKSFGRTQPYVTVIRADEGRLVTRPFLVPGGRLTVNVRSPRGSVLVRLMDPSGEPLDDLGAAAASPLDGDALAGEVRWPRPLERLRGRPVRLEFRLRKAARLRFRVLHLSWRRRRE